MLRYLTTTTILAMSATNLIADEISSAAVLRDLGLARETLETVHPGYTRYTPKDQLDASWGF